MRRGIVLSASPEPSEHINRARTLVLIKKYEYFLKSLPSSLEREMN